MNFNKAITWSGKIYKILQKLNLDGLISLDAFIDANFPEITSRLQTYASNSKIAVCSTNGKKTTVNLLNQILSANNQTFITNVTENAEALPVLTSIILGLSEGGLFDENKMKDFYTMALDEYEIAGYFNSMKFDYLLLNNLFYDQKSYLNLEEKRKKIQDAIVLNSNCNLIINADEPVFHKIDDIKSDLFAGKKLSKLYFGFNNIEIADDESLIQENDVAHCPVCGCKLDYIKRFYSHIGQYDCECGFKRPKLDISADVKIFSNYSFLNVYFKENKYVFKLPLGGVYNAYNALGAISLAIALNIERKTIANAFENYTGITARDEIIRRRGKDIKLKSVKNPVSLSEALRELLFEKRTKVVLCLNDKPEDGIDTSWIWNSNFNSLSGFENKIYVCGTRCDDMALRLKYAGVNPCLIIVDNSISNSVKCCFYELEKHENMIVFSVPSAVKEIKEILDK